MSTSMPWPALQRANIERVKAERWREFERTGNECFEWLESYFQGCLYAARQNKIASQPGQFTSSTPRKANYTPSSPRRDTTRKPLVKVQAHVHGGNDRKEACGMDIATQQEDHLPEAFAKDSTPQRKDQHPPPQWKSPKVMVSHSPMRSPRSPYDRHRFTPKRTRLKVDASAQTRKAQRALKTSRKRTGSYPGDTAAEIVMAEQSHGAGAGRSTEPSGKPPPVPQIKDTIVPTKTHSEHQEHKRSKEDRRTLDVAQEVTQESWSSLATEITQPSPVRRPKSLVQSSRPLGTHFRSRKTEEAENFVGVLSTPGFRARDSMTLISPVGKPPSSKDHTRESYVASTPGLSRALSRDTTLSTVKRSSSELDAGMEVDFYEAETKRPRGSPFLDSVAPVRFGSPERESTFLRGRDAHDEMQLKDTATSGSLARSFSRASSREQVERPSTSQERSTLQSSGYRSSSSNTSEPSRIHGRQASTSNSANELKHADSRPQDYAPSSAAVQHTERTGMATETQSRPHSRHMDSQNEASFPTGQREKMEGGSSAAPPSTPQNHQTGLGKLEGTKAHQAGTPLAMGNERSHVAGKQDHASEWPLAVLDSQQSLKDATTLKSRLTATQPIMRANAQKSRLFPGQEIGTQPLHPHPQMLPSRLTKLVSSTMSVATRSALEASSEGTTSSVLTASFQGSNKLSRTGSFSLFANGRSSSTTSTGTTSSSITKPTSSQTLQRSGITRPAYPSLSRPTESSLARSGSQNSVNRKPFVISRPTLTIKKPTRPVPPETSAFSRSGSSAPKLFTPTTTSSTSTLVAVSATNTSSSGGNPPSSPKGDPKQGTIPAELKRKNESVDPPLKPKTTSKSEESEDMSRNGHSTLAKDPCGAIVASSETPLADNTGVTSEKKLASKQMPDNPCLAPPPTRPPMLPSWAKNMMDPPPTPRTRTILPEISDDVEDHGDQDADPLRRRSRGPQWASLEELQRCMKEQSHLNPAEIFGAMPTLDIAEMFPARERVFRVRNSSAHWGAADRLTVQEIVKYNKDMGWSHTD